jgi:TP901 family phage tail tape measure protein
MPERDIRIRVFIDDSNLKPLATMTTLLQKAAAAEKTLMRSAINKNKAIQKQGKVVEQDGKELDKTGKKTRSWTRDIVRNIGKVAQWGIATGLLYGAIRTLRTGLDDIMDVEFAMAGLTKVMRDGEVRSKSLRGELLALGQQYGELGNIVVDASTEWARLQISTFEIAANAETALLAQAVAEMQVVDATRFLIASMQQFEQTSLSNIRTLDQWNELSNRMAARAVDLAQGAARAGSVIHNTGDSMAFLNGMTAALVQATGRSGEAIGTAIRTFGTYAFRIRSVNVLERSGIDVRNKATGSLRRFSDILTQTAIRWDTYTDVERRAIAQAIGGTRRQNEFITLMREFPEVLKAATIAAESFGSAEKEAAILLDTAQKKAEQLRAGLQRLMVEYSNTGPMKAFLDLLNQLINALIEAKEIIIVVTVVVGLVAAKALIAAIAASKLGVAIKGLVVGLMALNPWLIATVGAVVTAGLVWRSFRKEVDTTTDVLVNAAQKEAGIVSGMRARGDELDMLIKKYSQLAKAQEQEGSTRFADSLTEMAKNIESVARNIDKGFVFNTERWADSLDRARAILGELRTQTDAEAASTQASLRSRIDMLQRIIRFAEDYRTMMQNMPGRTGEFGMIDSKRSEIELQVLMEAWERNFKDIKKITADNLKDATEEVKKHLQGTGLVASSFWGNYMVDARKADEATENLKVTLATLEKLLRDISERTPFTTMLQDATLSLKEIRAEINRLNEASRHRAALATMAGATEVNALMLTQDAIGKSIRLVNEQITLYHKNGEEVDKLEALLGSLEQQQRNVNNRMREAGRELARDAVGRALERQTTGINNLYAADIKLAQGRKENVTATELQIQAMGRRAEALKNAIILTRLFGSSADKLEEELSTLNAEIALQTRLLNELIKPQEQSKTVADARAASEARVRGLIDLNNAAMERQLRILQASGAEEVELARLRLKTARLTLTQSMGHVRSLTSVLVLVGAVVDAYNELQAALTGKEFTDFEVALQGMSDQTRRQIALAKAQGATDIQMAKMRIEGIKKEQAAVVESGLSEQRVKKLTLDLTREMEDAANDLAVAEATAARESAEAWIKAYQKRRAAWEKLFVKGMTKEGILGTLERINEQLIGAYVKNAFKPVIDFLTDMEIDIIGKTPAEEIKASMIDGGEQSGQIIHDYMITAGEAIGLSISGATRKITEESRRGSQWAKEIGAVIKGEAPASSLSGGQYATAFGLTVGYDVINRAPDWLNERGGGVRAGGYVAGGTVAGILSGGNPAAIAQGGRMGESLISILQELKHAIWDDTEERKRPQEESLREQVGSAINRGTFGNAASITYHIENNVHMGFMLPDREAGRRAVAWIRENLSEYGANVTVRT